MNADTVTGSRRFPIVGIGASAGGLEAVRALFGAMPADLGIGFVLVQHLHPEHESMMVDLVARTTALEVVQIEEGMPVEPNRLHVIPPNRSLTIAQGRLYLNAPGARRGLRMPIDDFFVALAEDQQDQAIGIILSGTGSDGTAGVGMIKIRGGMLMAQTPSEAAHEGMPRSAIASGQIDYVLPVHEMPDALAAYVSHLRSGGVGVPADAANEQAIRHILALIRARLRHDLSWYKRATLRRRLLRRMALNQVDSLAEYVERLNEDDAELRAFTKDLLISVTAFFRDPPAWDELSAKVLPVLLRRAGDDPVRVWVPGCATGEEAYTLAILLLEALEAAGRSNQLMLFATDVDQDALEVARAGRYAESLVAGVDSERLERFFTPEGDCYQVKKFVRERVIFAPQDIFADPPFSGVDLVSCRNLLIYVDPEFQERIINLFHFALREDGFLFLGAAETVSGQEDLFRAVSHKHRIYRRREGDGGAAIGLARGGLHSLAWARGTRERRVRRPAAHLRPWVEQALLERFTPAAVLVDARGDVLYYHGNVGRYLGLGAGEPSNNLLHLVDAGLRARLSAALRAAASQDQPVITEAVRVCVDERWASVRITVSNVTEPESNVRQRLVVFEELPLSGDAPAQASPGRDGDQSLFLEQELESTRQELLTTIEESEAANEELKASNQEVMSMNEELQSSNEELQTSKEELQSLNQELVTLNNQLEAKIQELEQTNDDVTNLLFSTDIATLFLDRQLHVRRYTPFATRLMRLIPADVGRPFTDIVRAFDDPELIEDAKALLAGEERPPREIQSHSGDWYLRRLHPYRTERAPISGVVITFTEMTARKQAELALAESEAALRRVADAMPALIARVDTELRYTFNNAAYADWFGVEPESLAGTKVADLIGEETFKMVRDKMERALAGETQRYDAWLPYKGAGQRYCHVTYIPDRREDGRVIGLFALVSDLTERHQNLEAIERLNAENRTRAAELQALLDAAPTGIFVARDPGCKSIAMNDAGARLLGLHPDANPSFSNDDLPAPNLRLRQQGRELSADEMPMQVAARTGKPVHGLELEILLGDGSVKQAVVAAAPLQDAGGAPFGAIGILTDVTSLKAAERGYRETLERLNAHIDNSPVAALEWDQRQCILRWSPAAERLFGWSEAEAMSRSLEDLGLFLEQDRPEVATILNRLLARESEQSRGLYQNRIKGGGERWCEWCNSVLRDADGNLVSVLSLALDVTEHQMLEASLRDQAQRLEELDRRKNEFLSMLGHELRNPLAPVRNAIDRLALEGADAETGRAALELIDRQVRHIERLLHDLLDVARINRGAIELVMGSCDLRELIEQSLQAMDASIRQRRHQLEVAFPDAPVPVRADETRMVQVFSNLLHNAAKYTDDGGRIQVRLECDHALARVSIEDNGRGMEPASIEWLFDAFSQGPRSMDRADGGLGLGLTLVKQLVELHAGRIDAHSDGPQRGSRFTVSLPLAIGDSAGKGQAQPAARSDDDGSCAPEPAREPEQGQRVLVVDDNQEVLESAVMLLNAMGHEAYGVSSGAEALAAIAEAPPDLVLLDIGLPEMDGIEVARRLSAMPQRAELKLVAVSGYAANTLGEDAALFDDHLLKPAGRVALCSVLPSTSG